ncbi:MAG: hypothetical protein IT580_13410 [Verrucomicrobiales bacterium]|nr:hypothetical protein [Verrucomicrobiales bacterium]
MKTSPTPTASWSFWRHALLALCLVASTQGARAASLVRQTFNLQAGWNSIWLEVQPTNDVPATVFAGLPVESVWTFRDRLPAIDFIQNAGEPVWNRDQWLAWTPASRPEAIANNLFAIPGGRAFLVKVTSATTLNVTGRPVVRTLAWKADAYNLRGFPVDPGAPPTFGDFFRPSSAHFVASTGQLRSVYRLNASGAWETVAPSALMQHGVAYWVFSEGGSDYVAPFQLHLPIGGVGLDFGRQVGEYQVTLENLRTGSLNVTLGESPAPASPMLAYATFSPTNGQSWTDLPALLVQNLAPGQSRELRIAFRRQNLTTDVYESILEVRDNAGTRFLVPVRADRVPAAGTAAGHVGLWVGVASVDRVSEAHSGTLTPNRLASDGTPLEVVRTGGSSVPTPTRSSFNLRLLIHVDASGNARLLREVTQMWRDGTYRPGAGGRLQVDVPGRYVLVTDPARLREFSGVSLRDGSLAGRRYSSIGFDFPSSGPGGTNQFLPLSGTFRTGSAVTGTISLSEEFPTNPFKHRFHPDHDNLDARFEDYQAEAFAIQRAITLEIAATDPGRGGAPVAQYGYGNLAGTYRETISGLHREPIQVQGTFRLKRINEVAELNPPSTP